MGVYWVCRISRIPAPNAIWGKAKKKDMHTEASYRLHILFLSSATFVAFGNAYFSFAYSGFDYRNPMFILGKRTHYICRERRREPPKLGKLALGNPGRPRRSEMMISNQNRSHLIH